MTNIEVNLRDVNSSAKNGDSSNDSARPLLTCLLPVRNAAHELSEFFASHRGYCDAVVALDDGSTDDTLALLEAEPLVKVIVRNPVRQGYAAWNDATNRNRLLQAAADLNPRWILSLDADERIDEEDGRAPRSFLQGDAVPGLAYGFRNASMRLDTSQFWPRYIWVYRLFHFERGQRFPAQKLHFVPIPTSIPEIFRVKTTIRILHLGELTAERRLARFAKYLEADPARRFQKSYTASIEVIDEQRHHQWLPRPPFLPVLLEAAETSLQQPPAAGQPAITVIVLAQPGAAAICDSITSLVCPEEVEILVVAQGWSDQQRRAVHSDFPHIDVIPVPPGLHQGALRNAGLRQAHAPIVLFLEAGARVESPDLGGWLAAHRRGYVMVAGLHAPTNNSTIATAALRLQPQDGDLRQPAGELPHPPVTCSYARFALHEAGGFPEGMPDDDDVTINHELFRRGYLAWFDPALRVAMPAGPTGPLGFIASRFARGRADARRRLRPLQQTGSVLSSPKASVLQVVDRIRSLLHAQARHMSAGWQANMWVMSGHGAALLGATVECLRAWTRGDLQLGQSRPQMILWIGFDEARSKALLIQCDYFQQRLTAVPVSPGLRLRVDGWRKEVSLEGLGPRYRSLSPNALRLALEDAIGLDGVDYLIGDESDLNLILRPTGSQVRILPDAERLFVEALQVGRLVSSLRRKDIDLLQHTLG